MPGLSLPEELLHLTEPPRTCSYLPDQTAALEYRSYRGLSPHQLESMLERGWRRFGIDIFRPACAACTKCVPIRVKVQDFHPNKSQRRTLKKNSHITVTLHPAGVSEDHVRLYNDWHVDMTERRDWKPQRHTMKGYARSFLVGEYPSLHELQYRDGDELVGVGLIDCLPHSVSSVYFFHAPAWRDLGPGTFSLLCEIELARRLNLDFVYLGYWIGECPSMAYKNRFHPHQVLRSRPEDEEIPAWLNVDEETYNVANPADPE
ncbi:arginyltransferase [Planctomicrobium sp. SH661]|uniref:arginyltransferase n=1 Tax=Planctomicrobium sp. SH661 TaxID=3448124 RepID=UPI003F5BD4C1